jgi:uncharacterized membrane protein (DUF2068 family)
MQRPTGITIIAGYTFCGAVSSVVGFLWFSSQLWLEVAAVRAAGAGTRGVMALLMSFGNVYWAVVLILGVIAAVAAAGLWKLRNWARILTIILTALTLLFSALSLSVTLFLYFAVFVVVVDLVAAAISTWILWYMFRPHVKQAFGVV